MKTIKLTKVQDSSLDAQSAPAGRGAGMFRVKPAKGMLVRDPETGRHLATKGEKKPRNSYWLRRLNDADVVEITGGKSK